MTREISIPRLKRVAEIEWHKSKLSEDAMRGWYHGVGLRLCGEQRRRPQRMHVCCFIRRRPRVARRILHHRQG
jgi:hypothetical protein